ncbi:MAG: glutathione S-transferase family protein [Methyloligellaceae bacterium]
MYKLYYAPGTCALATHIVLNEIGQPVTAIDRASVENFLEINPTNAVPTLHTGEKLLTEGVAILLYLLEKHDNTLLPSEGTERYDVLEAMLFANATVHPAYGRLFYAGNAIPDEAARKTFIETAAASINQLWEIVNTRIGSRDYLVGNKLSPADILLTVYSDWGQYFPVNITLGENTERMITNVKSRQSYIDASTAQANG